MAGHAELVAELGLTAGLFVSTTRPGTLARGAR